MARRLFSLCTFPVGSGDSGRKMVGQNIAFSGSRGENGRDLTHLPEVAERRRHIVHSALPNAEKALVVPQQSVTARSKSDYLASLIVSLALSGGINTFPLALTKRSNVFTGVFTAGSHLPFKSFGISVRGTMRKASAAFEWHTQSTGRFHTLSDRLQASLYSGAQYIAGTQCVCMTDVNK